MSRSLVRLRIDFSPGRALGPGKVDLLEAVARRGSLTAAARDCGMSYKRAWTLLQDANELFGTPLVAMNKGGSGGGGSASVTAKGNEVIAAFRAAERKATAAAAQAFAALQPSPARIARRGAVKRLSRAAAPRRPAAR